MQNPTTEALEIVRQMSVQKMIDLKFITKEQLDEYMQKQFIEGLEDE